MATFPALSNNVSVSSSGYTKVIAHDSTLRNSVIAGYVVTRARFTRLVYKWHIVYKYILNSDKAVMTDFQNTVRVGADSFTWVEPDTGVSKVVRFLAPIEYARVGMYWNVEFDIEEV